MKVRELMNKQVITGSPNTALPEIWKLIFKKHIHGLPIVDKQGKLLGIVSEEDLLTKLFPDYADVIPDFAAGEEIDEDLKEKFDKLKKLTAEKVMNRRVVYTLPESNIMRALSRMIVRKIRQLPVVDEEGKLLGMISKGDIFDGLFKNNVKKLIHRIRRKK
ncbi:MAG: hypothetical protein UV61_C0011G0018 [Candidatus Gottesmanbacteria bacterium GW2011_GWB1_43_11]|uniref:CBS domain-containing protein n=1 Tax=Candidatus Gottesmanbacteria bacterium GW2011_GWB1_43_11 TaxID=1618446 RepID=A0A0G1CKM6_9BACT|nr:MAG: hypothetical protein UV04_C0013G0014 [Candidatus Gottesmanbacteria bacterium GW2011_GWA2_42_16]KKS55802.1 MAG: hypothetical protein UV17_C0007G0016 [Candidatus Gottesmanbacteria bacterium GW2011_GWA1_42_26]KKS82010.1 MAG: hypothetical protein UV55_C0006G0017 [Candidatus Gottesmanbacteria bacterium GW2011_GWC1_43_10]KKS86370.1 MAG: hypothetical protein UV61_C0011G0018 [Candidatus Gottesmanbacteria bacterium GW2011_GWB1_43_11]OGG07975.1 MAG: hypothetical protein A2699_01720 [Candidatus Go